MREESMLRKRKEYSEEMMGGQKLMNQEVQRISKEEVRAAMERQLVRIPYLWRYGEVW